MRTRTRAGAGLAGAAVAVVLLSAGRQPVSAHGTFGFAAPNLLDHTLGGGEPFVAYSPVSHRLVYTSHEGTTHIFSKQAPVAPAESGGWVANYANQVNIWTSADGGGTWSRVNYLLNFFQSPAQNTGFSDPDLTQDEGGRIYDTGIDLANDALFSSSDGGVTWATGTVQCHEGDRPWLAGGKKDEVFLSTDADNTSPSHIVVHSTDGGATCGSTFIGDQGGDGKLFYDHARGQLVEANFSIRNAIGLAVLPNASSAFGATPGHFTTYKVAGLPDSTFAHWPALAIDSADNYYMVWDTDNRVPGTSGGCGSEGAQQITGNVGLSQVENESPAANSIMMSSSTDGGRHWSAPMTVAHVPGHFLLWPWVTAGSAGKVAVAWYQYDQLVDPNCAPDSSSITVQAAEIFGATDPAHATESIVNASGRAIHSGPICQGGTFCAVINVATNEDRRLGDFFTVSTDQNGCVLVATGDTTQVDAVTGQQSPISHPLFIRQNSGPSLTGQDCARTASAGGPTTVTTPAGGNAGASAGLANTAAAGGRAAPVVLAGAAALLVPTIRRRRRRAALGGHLGGTSRTRN